AENQVESHLLQPLVVGRVVRLHPLAIIMVLAVGGIVAGIPGALVAVPGAGGVSFSLAPPPGGPYSGSSPRLWAGGPPHQGGRWRRGRDRAGALVGGLHPALPRPGGARPRE